MSTHTVGPWYFDEDTGEVFAISACGRKDRCIAAVESASEAMSKEDIENGHLLASAPGLKAEVKRLNAVVALLNAENDRMLDDAEIIDGIVARQKAENAVLRGSVEAEIERLHVEIEQLREQLNQTGLSEDEFETIRKAFDSKSEPNEALWKALRRRTPFRGRESKP